MPARVQGQEQRASQQWKGGCTAAVRRRPSATDPGIRDGPFPQARKATPAAHQGTNLMEEAEPPKENVDPKRYSWLECEPLPLPQLRERRGAVPSRGDVIEAKIADASGRAAGKVMLEALEVEPAQEAGIFARVACSGVVDPELANYAVPWYVEGAEGDRGSPLYASGTWKVRRDGSRSALLGVGSCARRSRSRSRWGISGDKCKDRQRSKTRDCRGWASPFRTDGRRKAGGPSGGSGGRVGSGPTRETDGTKKFQRAKEPSVGKQR